jgi:hypothetical protein
MIKPLSISELVILLGLLTIPMMKNVEQIKRPAYIKNPNSGFKNNV